MATFYITTPIYYVNGAPHIGHAYTTIICDIFARHYRQRGDEVFFLTGTDEHGLKVQREAEGQGITPKALADKNSQMFRDLFNDLQITHDRFIRTTEDDHKKVAQTVYSRMKENGDVYLDTYAGWYSASDEAFYDESEIEDGKAISSGSPVEWVEESSYFFRLSAYEQRLLEWYNTAESVLPASRRNEVAAFVEQGLRDLSISRTTFDWGVPVPDDPEHILYVWVDALSNYITGIGAFHDDETFQKFWPCDVHVIGKDILRFHAVYWPAFLMSAGIEPPRQVFAHGWWLNEGEKMSKSKNNFIDAFELAKEFDLDVLRYYLTREMPFGADGNFVRARLAERNNSELADNLGNLVSRVTKMIEKFFDGKVPDCHTTEFDLDNELRATAESIKHEVASAMDSREPHRALESAMRLSHELNLYVQKTAPWKLAKEGEDKRLAHALYHALEGIRWTAVLLSAFLPGASAKILSAFQTDDASWEGLTWGALTPGATVEVPENLFQKLEIPVEEVAPAEEAREKKSKKKAIEAIDFKDFQSVELRVGLIKTAERIEGSDKLLRLMVDVGEENPRQIVAGIATSFDAAELVGKSIAVVANLKPAKIFGVESQGMLLAADRKGGGLALTEFSHEVKPGTRIA